MVKFREAAWPCAIDVWSSSTHLLQRKYSFMTHNNKARCKKYVLVTKMTISIWVNRKLLRIKSTTKPENNRTLKRTVFSYSGPSPGGLQQLHSFSIFSYWLRIGSQQQISAQSFTAFFNRLVKCNQLIVPKHSAIRQMLRTCFPKEKCREK